MVGGFRRTVGWVGLGFAGGLCALAVVYGGAALAERAADPIGYVIDLHRRWPAFLVLDGLPVLLGWVGWLVAQLRARERELGAFEAQLGPFSDGALARTTLDAVLLVDGKGEIVACNLATRLLYDHDPLGRTIHDLLVDLDRADPPTTERRGLDGQLLGVEWHLTARCADGRFVPVRVTCGPASGRRVVYVIAQDRPEATRTAQDTAALTRERDRARAASRASAALLASVGRHLVGALDELVGQVDALPGTEPAVQQARDHAHALQVVAEDVVDWSRLEGGRLTLVLEPTWLGPVYDLVRKRVGPLPDGVTLVFRGAPLAVRVDGPRLVRILVHLVRLAARGAGGVVRVAARLDPDDPRLVRIEVADAGEGQALDPAPFDGPVFDDDGQLHSVRFGLVICRRLAVAMGGTVSIASDSGRTTLQLGLPAVPTQQTLVPPGEWPSRAGTGPVVVVGAPDEALEDAMRQAGAPVVFVEATVPAAVAPAPQAVLVDLEAFERLAGRRLVRSLVAADFAPVLVASAEGPNEELPSGIAAVLESPVDPGGLLSALETVDRVVRGCAVVGTDEVAARASEVLSSVGWRVRSYPTAAEIATDRRPAVLVIAGAVAGPVPAELAHVPAVLVPGALPDPQLLLDLVQSALGRTSEPVFDLGGRQRTIPALSTITRTW